MKSLAVNTMSIRSEVAVTQEPLGSYHVPLIKSISFLRQVRAVTTTQPHERTKYDGEVAKSDLIIKILPWFLLADASFNDCLYKYSIAGFYFVVSSQYVCLAVDLFPLIMDKIL